ncbi:MAG: Hsp20/alpha crystallin family protein [Bacteroidetes bacterium]|nr:Hsp20/alpha crystallin family protein [Bacteroidota bacterium]
MFDDFFNNDIERFKGFDNARNNLPAVNVSETEKTFHLEVVAPGYKKDDFKLHVEDDLLTISSEMEESHEEKDGKKLIRKEYSKRSFSRSFTLPENVEAENISATYNDGLLGIDIPKKEVEVKAGKREISIS